MSTDLLTYGKKEQPAAQAAALSGLYKPALLKTPEAARKKSPIAPKGLFESTIDGWNRKLSATLAHLTHAQQKISEYEALLDQQRQRIALLEELATSDELTGLKNRRGFYDGFMRELECCERGISKGGLLILIDLDNFKAVNDTYGHAAGDAVLKLVGRTLRNDVRKMDVAARMGGDEFILLMSNTTQAETRAQSIGWQLNNLSLAWYGNVIPVQASVGLRAFGTGDLVEKVLGEADASLYETKFGRKKACPEEQGGTGMIGQLA